VASVVLLSVVTVGGVRRRYGSNVPDIADLPDHVKALAEMQRPSDGSGFVVGVEEGDDIVLYFFPASADFTSRRQPLAPGSGLGSGDEAGESLALGVERHGRVVDHEVDRGDA